MKHSEFIVDFEFYAPDGTWRCTDIGTRVIVAIQVDTLVISKIDGSTGKRVNLTIDGLQAKREGWFDGPPYICGEVVFDENRMEACWPF